GAVQNRLGGSDELVLHGRGRRRRYVPLGVTFALCGLGLAALPPFGPFLAKSLVEQSAARMGWAWLAPLLTVATTCSAAAVLRAAGRIFLGLGDRNDPLLSEQPDEADDREPREPLALMLTPAVALLVAGLGLAFAPTLAQRALH